MQGGEGRQTRTPLFLASQVGHSGHRRGRAGPAVNLPEPRRFAMPEGRCLIPAILLHERTLLSHFPPVVIPCATWLVPESSRGHLWEWARPASQGLCLHVASQSWSTFRCDNTGQLITVVPFLLPPYVGAFAPPKNVAVPGSRTRSRVVE